AVRALWGAEIAQAHVRLGKALQQRRREPRFADAGLAREQHHLAFAGFCPGPAPKQPFRFFLAPDEGGEAGGMHRLEAACHGTRLQHRPRPHRPGNALEAPRPKVIELEEIAEKSSRALGDDDRIRFGNALQPRRKVQRLAYHAALLRLARWNQVPDDNQSCANPCPYLLGSGPPSHGGNQPKPSLSRALSVTLMGLRIAKVHQGAIPQISGDEPAEVPDGLSDAFLIRRNDLSQVFR